VAVSMGAYTVSTVMPYHALALGDDRGVQGAERAAVIMIPGLRGPPVAIQAARRVFRDAGGPPLAALVRRASPVLRCGDPDGRVGWQAS
jgi:hypothetical protein